MKTETKRMSAYVGLVLTFASMGFFASRRAFAVPFGDVAQCSASTVSCDGEGWAYLGVKPVSCCCTYKDMPQHWFRCVSTIQVYVNLRDNTIHCYREITQERTPTPCIPIAQAVPIIDWNKPNPDFIPLHGDMPETLPKGSCCNR